jgi:hypothetical protein
VAKETVRLLTNIASLLQYSLGALFMIAVIKEMGFLSDFVSFQSKLRLETLEPNRMKFSSEERRKASIFNRTEGALIFYNRLMLSAEIVMFAAGLTFNYINIDELSRIAFLILNSLYMLNSSIFIPIGVFLTRLVFYKGITTLI